MKLWGKWAPIILWTLNVNYSQTRKSGLTMLAERQAQRTDEKLKSWLIEIAKAKGEPNKLHVYHIYIYISFLYLFIYV